MMFDMIFSGLTFLAGMLLFAYTLICLPLTYRKAKKSGIVKFHFRHGRFYYILGSVVIFWGIALLTYYIQQADFWHVIFYIGYILVMIICAVSEMGYITNDGWYGINDKHPRKLISKTGNHELWFYFAGSKNNYLFLHIPDTPENRQKFRELLIRKEELL